MTPTIPSSASASGTNTDESVKSTHSVSSKNAPLAEDTEDTVAEVKNFDAFNLSESLTKAMKEMGFTSPTPIQEQALPILMGDSHDFIGLASTGTGKTAAFGIPLIERIDADDKSTQALVLSPTRELAIQVSEQLAKLGKYKGVRVVTIYGGASYRTQTDGIKRGAHIVVATPGRLVDFIDQKMIKLSSVQTLVLDEADEMISMGFKDDLEAILKATHKEGSSSGRASCKTWLFSATMSADIRRVANTYLENPKTVAVNKSGGGLSETVEQIYYTVKNSHKQEVIGRLLQVNPDFYGIVFCQTKMEVAQLADALNRRGFPAEALHGDRSQKEREVTLARFRARDVQVIVATDVAARGLDVKDLTHVINHSLPWDVESYVHRIGRTGRNGKKGIAISLINPEQLRSLKRIQMTTRVTMGKGKVPTADDIAILKIREVYKRVMSMDSASPVLLLAQSYVEDLVKEKATEFETFTKEEVLARFVAAYYPEVFIKNDLMLDYVGDRIPRELTEGGGSYGGGGGRSRPPVGARSYDRGGGAGRSDRGGYGGYSRDRNDRGGDRDRNDSPRERQSYGDRSGVPRFGGGERSFEKTGERGPAPRTERNDRERGPEDRPRRSYSASNSAPRNEGFAARPPRAESSESSRPRRDRDESAAPRFAARREDPKGVTRHRPYKRKSKD